jgi:hypothetical protein
LWRPRPKLGCGAKERRRIKVFDTVILFNAVEYMTYFRILMRYYINNYFFILRLKFIF